MRDRSDFLNRRRAALTLVEVLVCMGIISILACLLLPAVQAAREAARRTRCTSNLRQIGVAMHAYLSTYSVLPMNKSSAPGPGGQGTYNGNYSVYVRLLPYLDQRVLHDSINFEVGTMPLEIVGSKSVGAKARDLSVYNSTAYRTGIAVLLCPSDSGAFEGTGCNYRANTGVGPLFSSNALHPDGGNGLFPDLGWVSAASVPDGLAHTAAFSERNRGPGEVANPILDRDIFVAKAGMRMGTADDSIRHCRASAYVGAMPFRDGGRWWFWSGRERTLYNHAQAPNGAIPDCLLPAFITTFGLLTPRSQHPGGVNVLMGDGSIRFVNENVSLAVWRGLGTRNGGELVD
jgi:prepilin-type N-terminal cleavage/methylation domain-containing protein/prepilin-type processing-associated H-X9-DG protein